MNQCLKCKSQNIIPGVRLLESGSDNTSKDIKLAVDEDPEAIFFHGRTETPAYAHVCADCGYVEIYAQNPKLLFDAYAEIIKNKAGSNPK